MSQSENNADRSLALARRGHEELEKRYRSHRSRVTDDQAGEMLLLFCHFGLSSQTISERMSIPLDTVRTVISYACAISLNLYGWHKDSNEARSGKGQLPPSNAAAYKHYAPPI